MSIRRREKYDTSAFFFYFSEDGNIKTLFSLLLFAFPHFEEKPFRNKNGHEKIHIVKKIFNC